MATAYWPFPMASTPPKTEIKPGGGAVTVTYHFKLLDENDQKVTGTKTNKSLAMIIKELDHDYAFKSIYLWYVFSSDADGNKLD
jgi:hypothetical protein